MATTVGDFLIQRLHDWGVRRVYGYPGDGINGLVGAFDRMGDKMEFIQTATRSSRRSPPPPMPNSPARSGSAWRPRARAPSTC